MRAQQSIAQNPFPRLLKLSLFLSVVGLCCSVNPIVGAPLSAVGLITGLMSAKRGSDRRFVWVAIVLSVLGLAMALYASFVTVSDVHSVHPTQVYSSMTPIQ